MSMMRSAILVAALLSGLAVGKMDRAVAATTQFASANWDYNNFDPSLQPNRLVAIDDETAAGRSPFDYVVRLDSTSDTPLLISLPPALPLLLSALAGVAWLGRRRKSFVTA